MKSYVPGSWYAVLGDAVTLLLAPEERSRVAGLWSLVDDGAAFDDVLDELLTSGLSGLTGFALVGHAAGRASGGALCALARGEVRATFETTQGPVGLEGSGARTWRELELGECGGFDLVIAGDTHGGAPMNVTGGLLRASRVSVRLTRPDALSDALSDATADLEDRLDLGVGAGAIPVAVVSRAPRMPDTPDNARPTPSAAVGSEPVGDTVRPATSAASGDRAVARLQLSSGEQVDVDRPILFGRRPEALGIQPGEQPRLVQLVSPLQEISATHLEIRPGTGAYEGTAVATDLGSTNGTLLAQPGRGPETLPPRTPVRLSPGGVLDLGDGLTIQVL